MAQFVASAELALQFCGFRNVDLYSQGIYQLRVSVAGRSSGRPATPFAILDAKVSANHPKERQFHLPAHILDATQEFCTPAFRVRYCEEELLLKSLVRLRIDLDAVASTRAEGDEGLMHDYGDEGAAVEELAITIKLMHAKSTIAMEVGGENTVESLSLRHFNVAATQTLIVRLPLPTISAFYPVTFADWHFCYVPLMLHATPLAYRLARPSMHLSPPKTQTLRAQTPGNAAPDATGGRALRQRERREGAALAALISASERDSPPSHRQQGVAPSQRGAPDAHGRALSGGRDGDDEVPLGGMLVACARNDLQRKASTLLKAALALSARIAVLERLRDERPARSRAASRFVDPPAAEDDDVEAPAMPQLQLPAGVGVDAEALKTQAAALEAGGEEQAAVDHAAVEVDVGDAPGTTDVTYAEPYPSTDDAAQSIRATTAGTDAAQPADAADAAAPPADAADAAATPRAAAAPAASSPPSSPTEAEEGASSSSGKSSGRALEETLLTRLSRYHSTKAADVGVALDEVLSTLQIELGEGEDGGGGRSGGAADAAAEAVVAAARGGSGRQWAERAVAILNDLSEQIWPRWQRLLDLVVELPEACLYGLADEYIESAVTRLGESVFREVRLFEQRAYAKQAEGGMPTALMAASLRGSAYYKHLPPPRVRDAGWHANRQPVLFERKYASARHPADEVPPKLTFSWAKDPRAPAAPAPSGGGVHVIVFVHGFQGNSFDLRTMRDHIALVHPHKDRLRYVMSSSNEEHTAKESFETLGANLATEVLLFLRNERLTESASLRLSFVCHSFGSIIARVALSRPDMQPLHDRLHTYVSFSGPHLGMLYGSNGLVELGMWGLRRWSGAKCLTELSLKDAKDPHDSLLYRLSKQPVLGLFKNVLFVSSVEDRYVPHHSARVQLTEEATHDPKHGPLFISMVHHLLAPLAAVNLVHLEVHFGEPSGPRFMSKIDAAIGRTAHIGFLDNEGFINMFVTLYLRYFV